MKNEVFIVSRHQATIDWLKMNIEELKDSEVYAQIDNPADIVDKVIYGNLPLQLAVLTKAVFAVEFDKQPPRGVDLTPQELDKFGIRVSKYIVLNGMGK